jgi:hypothetical protein
VHAWLRGHFATGEVEGGYDKWSSKGELPLKVYRLNDPPFMEKSKVPAAAPRKKDAKKEKDKKTKDGVPAEWAFCRHLFR